MANLAQAVARLASQVRPTGRRIGTVRAIDATTGTLSVSMGGDDVQGIPWQASSYSPVVGDQVTILWDQSAGMLVTGTLSTVQVREPELESFTLSPAYIWFHNDQKSVEGGDPYTGLPWQLHNGYTPGGWPTPLPQGFGYAPVGGGGPAYVPLSFVRSTWATFPAISAPGELVSVAAKISPAWTEGAQAVTPVLYLHNYTASTGPTIGQPPEPLVGPLGLAPLVRGETARFPLPQSWAADLLAGAATGVGVWSNREADRGDFLIDLIVTYSPPPAE